MTRLEWLNKQHKSLDEQVSELEKQRSNVRDYNHKALLTSLKKQRLAIKTELESISKIAS